MSKLITINGYSIKLSKKDVAGKLEMIANDCKGDIYGFRKDITCVMCGIAKNSLDNIDYNNVKRVFTIGYSIGRYTDVNSVSLKSNANLTDCVKSLMVICDELLSYGNVEYVDKLLPNYRPNWFITGQEVEETQADTVNAEPVEKPMFAYVKEKATKKNAIIRSAYATKKNFISDLRHNGYAVRYVCLDTPEEIEKASQKYHDNLDLQRNIQRTKREHATNHVEYANMTNDLIEFLKELKIIVSNEYEEYNGEKSKLTNDQLKRFYDKVKFIKNVLGYKGTIINGELNHNENALATYVRCPRVIVVDNAFIDDCFSGYTNGKDIFGNDITETICHEIAHDTYFYHGRWHSRLTTQLYEKVKEYEDANETKNEKEVKKAMKKTNRDFKVNGVTYSVVNNPNYNKEFAFEKSCMKYYAMKLIIDGVSKAWVKTDITANTIANVKEKVAEWEDFTHYIENYDKTKPAEVTNKIYYKSVTNDRKKGYSKIFHAGEIYELKDLKNNTVVYGECVRVNYKTVDFVIDGVKTRLKVIKGTIQYSARSKKYDVFSTHIVEPVEPAEPVIPVNVDNNTNYPVKDTNNLTLSDTAIINNS